MQWHVLNISPLCWSYGGTNTPQKEPAAVLSQIMAELFACWLIIHT